MRNLSPIQLIQLILLINGVLWIGTGVASMLRSNSAYTLPGFNIFLLVELFMFGYGLVMVILSIQIARKISIIYSVTLAISIFTLLISFIDNLGFLDILYISFITVQIILLLKYQRQLT